MLDDHDKRPKPAKGGGAVRSLAPALRFSGPAARAFDVSDRAYDLAASGRNIIHLSVGDPDFDTPRAIVDSAIDSLNAGRTHYSPIGGDPDLRRTIADHASRQYGQAIDPDRIVVFAGAQNALFATMLCLAEAGDEVILVEPTYTTYDAVARAGGGTPVRVPATSGDPFTIDMERIETAITGRTRAILINSPGNPSGAMIDADRMARLVRLCRQRDIWLVSDEVYWPFVYEGAHCSPLSLAAGQDTSFVINSLSKSHAMTGWRLGWTIAPEGVAGQLVDLAQSLLFGVNQFVQDAAVTALSSHLPELDQMRAAFRQRRDRLYAGLCGIPGIRPHKPAGGMFLVVDVSALGLDGEAFAEQLLDREGVSVVPGFGFGASMKGFVRIGFLANEETLDQAVDRIRSFVNGFPADVPT